MTTKESQPASFVELIGRNRQTAGKVLLAVGILLIFLTIYSFITSVRSDAAANPEQQKSKNAQTDLEKQKRENTQEDREKKKEAKPSSTGEYMPLALGCGLMAVLAFVAGSVLLARIPAQSKEVYETRIVMVATGATAGLLVALLGFVYALRWQQSVVDWVNNGDLHEARWVLAALTIFLAGLALMFVGMLPARAEERNSVVLRRLLYGTNSVLTGLVLLLLLAVVNVIVFLKLPETVITTAAGFRGLGEASKEFLQSIKEPVKLYLIMPRDYRPGQPLEQYASLYADCKSLLDAVESENKNIKAVYLFPATDDAEIKRTLSRYKIPEARRGQFGLLVAYGDNDDLSEFISPRELLTLISVSQDPRNPRYAPAFQGENQLMNQLDFLSGGAKRPVVYFTQGHGEPAIVEASKQNGPRTAFFVVEYLKERKFDVKPLYIEPGKPIPPDAAVVVVAAPTKPFSQDEAGVLTKYMAPRKHGPTGKLVAMLPAFPAFDGSVSTTGLEPMLQNLGVQLEEKRLFSLPKPSFTRIFSPLLVPGSFALDIRRSNTPLNRLLGENDYILFSNVRPVRYERARPSEIFSGVNLFSTVFEWETYRDKKYKSTPDEIQAQIEKEDKQNLRTTYNEKQGTQQYVQFGALVVETVEGEETGPRPCAVVIGSDSFVSDEAIRQSNNPNLNIAMMGAFLNYVRERPQGMNIAPRALGTFQLQQQPNNVVLLYLPFAVVVLGIAALGVGVWFSRRT